MGVSSRGRSESREQYCSAVSLLWDLHAFRQREKDTLTKLNERWVNVWPAQQQIQMILIHIQHNHVTYCEIYTHEKPKQLYSCRARCADSVIFLPSSLDSGSLRLLCLYIRLATVRAQRETTSYRALLSARQSWEAW